MSPSEIRSLSLLGELLCTMMTAMPVALEEHIGVILAINRMLCGNSRMED